MNADRVPPDGLAPLAWGVCAWALWELLRWFRGPRPLAPRPEFAPATGGPPRCPCCGRPGVPAGGCGGCGRLPGAPF